MNKDTQLIFETYVNDSTIPLEIKRFINETLSNEKSKFKEGEKSETSSLTRVLLLKKLLISLMIMNMISIDEKLVKML